MSSLQALVYVLFSAVFTTNGDIQPSPQFKENPSWLAVQPLQNTFIPLDPPSNPIDMDVPSSPTSTAEAQPILNEEPKRPPPREIRISALQIPIEYEAITSIVPGLHGRPPCLPESAKNDISFPSPPERGYDFIFHIGPAGRGPLRMEKLAHKSGYHMKDATSKYAPQCTSGRKGDESNGNMVVAAPGAPDSQHAVSQLGASNLPDGQAVDNFLSRSNRGFGVGYERFEEGVSGGYS